jgi:hypothetical protein
MFKLHQAKIMVVLPLLISRLASRGLSVSIVFILRVLPLQLELIKKSSYKLIRRISSQKPTITVLEASSPMVAVDITHLQARASCRRKLYLSLNFKATMQ